MSQPDDDSLKDMPELTVTVEGFDPNDNEFKQMLEGIITQSINESETFSAITTDVNSQKLIESQPEIGNQQTGPWPPVEQEHAMTQEFENKLNPQIFIEIINNIITKLGEKYARLDLISKIKIILSNPMLLGALITSLAGTLGYVRSFWSNPLNLYTNILGGIFAYITTNILTNPQESSEVIALLDVNFITKYYGKVLEIEKIKTSNMQQDMLNRLDQMKNEEEEKSLKVLRETAEIEKASQTILEAYERSDKLRDARRVLSQANSLKSGIDIVNFYNFLSKVLPRNDKVSKDIEKIVFNSLDSPDLFREIVDKIIELEKTISLLSKEKDTIS
jgi:hypothetical protein